MIRGDEHILIIKLSSIGDVVHTIPFVEVLKKNYPDIKIDWCIDREIYPLIRGYPSINKVVISDRNIWKKALLNPLLWNKMSKQILLFAQKLRKEKYDIVVDLQGLLKSGIITGISKAKRKIGLNGAREYGWIFVKEKVKVNYSQHAIDRYLQVATYLGCKDLNWKWPLYITEQEKNKVEKLIKEINKNKLPLIVINPIARWKTKLWPLKNFSELSKRLSKIGFLPVLIGSKNERSILDQIEGAINLAGVLELNELIHLYSNAYAVISVDTGPMHIAVMSGSKVIALFGPTDPKRTGPYGNDHIILKAGLSCSPCFKKDCKTIACMKKISVDMVIKALEVISLRR